jgi:hypothetical protein
MFFSGRMMAKIGRVCLAITYGQSSLSGWRREFLLLEDPHRTAFFRSVVPNDHGPRKSGPFNPVLPFSDRNGLNRPSTLPKAPHGMPQVGRSPSGLYPGREAVQKQPFSRTAKKLR